MSNTCHCPTPPGGQVVCETHQLAVCIIEDGQARMQCLDPIKTDNSLTLVNWALSQITGEVRAQFSIIDNRETSLLAQGRYWVLNKEVTFSLPPKLKDAVQEVMRGRGRNRGFERGQGMG